MAETYDYTLVLSGGKAYKNAVSGETVSLEGLSYADGVWTMSDFTFTTTASTALQIAEGATTTITVTGENSITGGEASGFTECSYGARFADNTRLLGDGSLTITAGPTERTTSIGIQNDQDLLIEGITLTVTTSTAGSRSGLISTDGTLTVEDATVSLTNSASMRLGSTVNAIVNGTGKITTGYVVGTIEPQAVAKDVDGNDLTWNGSTYEKADGSIAYEVVLTATDAPTDPDYTLVLSGGKAYKNTESGEDITTEVAAMGLTYDRDCGWTMENFNFTTTATVAVQIAGTDATTITVTGSNSITGGDTTASTTVSGLSVNAVTNLQGTGSLTVNSGKSLNELSEGISVWKDLTVQGITLTVNSGDSLYSYGMMIYDYDNPTLTVTDAAVNLNGGNVSSADDGDSIGLVIGGDTNVIVNGTGKITAAAGSASTVWGVAGTTNRRQPRMTPPALS